MPKTIEELVKEKELQPHPEGGYFKETYRAKEEVKVSERYRTDEEGDITRSACTMIDFLMLSGNFSAWHKIKSEEIWQFCEGSPITIYMLNPETHEVTSQTINEESRVCVVPHETWFAADVSEEDSYGLVTCIVTPGFDFKDFTLGNRDGLISEFPEHEEEIKRFSRVEAVAGVDETVAKAAAAESRSTTVKMSAALAGAGE